jgi:2-polyprenyl-6-methoxyphenol hydroxylase-like FAD-dependent oxidoreductase
MRTLDTRCVIAGGGPAGMMLGLLLARAGIDTIVLEKHADFLRDFRGDTVHPSTLELMHELGVLDEFLARPHQQVQQVVAEVEGERVTIADFAHLPSTCNFLAFMPQWEFLDFLADRARRYPSFRLLMNAEVTAVTRSDGRVTGVVASTPEGPLAITGLLTIGADGRSSAVREHAGLEVKTFGAPIDVLWMRLSRRDSDPTETLGILRSGHILVTLNRGDYWQCAFVIPKGAFEELRTRGLEALGADVARTAPTFADRVGELRTWDDVRLLTVKVDRLIRWHAPGLLCIGDAAHAMSPIGGVGINLAVQDAVATANLLYEPLRAGAVSDAQLAAVQRRRMLPTRATQRVQVLLQKQVLARAISSRGPLVMPAPLRLVRDLPALRRIAARMVGLGVRPEHSHTPEG